MKSEYVCTGIRAHRTISAFCARVAAAVSRLSAVFKHPGLWIVTAAVVCLPAVAFRLFAGAGTSQMSDVLQAGARLLALTMVFPLDFD
jgi:hypothetical protein